jgi:hypothetical protein
MDGAPSGVVWHINPGDLVKIKKFDIDGREYFDLGLVLEEKTADQESLFPRIRVYEWKNETSTYQSPDTLEIISHALPQ